MSEKNVRSPCVAVCSLNADDFCVGCWRTGDEIVNWPEMTNDERREVLVRCRERARAAGWTFD